MDQQDDIQYDPEVLPPEAGEGGVAPALADDVLPDTLVLCPYRVALSSPRAAGRLQSGQLAGHAGCDRSAGIGSFGIGIC